MIVDRLTNSTLYQGIGERLGAALRWLQTQDLAAMAPGRHPIRGDEIFVLVQHYQPRSREGVRWEAHRRYIDLQYVARGRELFGYAPLDALQVTRAYSEKDDALLLEGPGSFLTVSAGTFLVLGPQDAHMPGLALADGPNAEVLKAVLKVAVA